MSQMTRLCLHISLTSCPDWCVSGVPSRQRLSLCAPFRCPRRPRAVSLILAARRAALGPRSGFLAPLVQQRVAGGVDVFDFHLVVIHAYAGQSAGHLLLWQEDTRVSWWEWWGQECSTCTRWTGQSPTGARHSCCWVVCYADRAEIL